MHMYMYIQRLKADPVFFLFQILATSSSDNIHQVTINIASDILEQETQTTISSLSVPQPLHHMNPPASTHPSLLSSTAAPSSSGQMEPPESLVLSPHLMEQGNPTSSLLVSTVQNPPSSNLLTSTQGRQYHHHHQLQHSLEPHLSNILVQDTDDISPDQYMVHPSPVLDTAGNHSVSLNPTVQTLSDSLSSIVQQGAEFQVTDKNLLSHHHHSMTPIDATSLQPTSQGEGIYQNIACEVSLGSVTESTDTLSTLTSSLPP